MNACNFFMSERDDGKLTTKMKGCRKFALNARMDRSRRTTHRFAVDSNHLCYYQTFPTGMRLDFSESDVECPVQALRNLEVDTDIPMLAGKQPLCGFLYRNPMRFEVSL